MPRNTSQAAPTMFSQVVQSLSRWMPRAETAAERAPWADADRSWHNSSLDLARGLDVIEVFDQRREMPTFADTMPAYHEPQPPTQAHAVRSR